MRAIKTLLLLTALTMLLVLGERIAGREGMTFGLIIAVVMNGGAYFFSDKIAIASSGARPVTREKPLVFTRSWSGWQRRATFRCPSST